MTKELNPCLDCGRAGKVWHTYDITFCVQCEGCGASHATGHYDTREEAIQAWNEMNEPKDNDNDTTTEEISQCPFCGSQKVALTGTKRFAVQCNKCGARTKAFAKTGKAVKSWNARAVSPKQLYADEMFDILNDIRNQLWRAVQGKGQPQINAVAIQELIDKINQQENS